MLNYRNSTSCGTEEKPDSWWCIDLGENYVLFITHYALKSDRNDPILRKWQLQGSTDKRDWRELKTEKIVLENPYFTTTWSVDGNGEAFRYFRILQKGINSNGKYGIYLCAIELYGVLEVREGKEALNSKNLKM